MLQLFIQHGAAADILPSPEYPVFYWGGLGLVNGPVGVEEEEEEDEDGVRTLNEVKLL